MLNLIIVESPNKCKKIQAYLGQGWIVKASMGHVRDLPTKTLGVDLQSFQPEYVANDRGNKVITGLKKLSKTADQIYLATDPDREGEAIAWHLQQALHLKTPKRITFNEITHKAIKAAVNQPGEINMALVRAQEGRRVLDRLVGYSVSPALSNAHGSWLTAGRVQSVALRIVVEREQAIKAFKPTAYVEVFLHFETEGLHWSAQWQPGDRLPEGLKHWTDRAFAERVAEIRNVVVRHIEQTQRSRRPPPPFITSSLQQGASVTLKLSPKRCMQEAQHLFEEGLITYHRTDNPNLSEEGVLEVMDWLNRQGYAEHVVEKPNTWKAKAEAQEGHEAIRPTSIGKTPDQVEKELTPDQARLYRMIWERTVASQMKAARYHVTQIHLDSIESVDGEPLHFLAKGEQQIYAGWLLLSQRDVTEEARPETTQSLPALEEDQRLSAQDSEIKDKQTQPPARYTEASLIKKLEAEGIGRPSTYAAILENILKRNYIAVVKRNLQAEELGILIVETLRDRFQFMELGYTRMIEAQLDEIARGRNQYRTVVSEAYAILRRELSTLDGLRIGSQATHHCPECNQPLRLIQNKFWGCTGYPDCRYTAPNENGQPGVPRKRQIQAEDTTYPCVCGNGHLQRRSHQGRHFWGCSTYPTCKHTQPDQNGVPGTKARQAKQTAGAGQACPTCQSGQLVKRVVKNGKNSGKPFIGCTNYPECRHFAWCH